MHEYYFANYRLLVDDAISSSEHMEYLAGFSKEMPATHTFTIHMGDDSLLDQKYTEATTYPIVCTTERFNLHNTQNTWTFVSLMDEEVARHNGKYVLTCTKDYSEMTLYISHQPYYYEKIRQWVKPWLPFSSSIRAACEAGMTMRDGMPLHAALVEKDGYGVVFLGPSGMGKSTQAKLWVEHQGADFIIGDRPGLRRIDGQWIGFGMPWVGRQGWYQTTKAGAHPCAHITGTGTREQHPPPHEAGGDDCTAQSGDDAHVGRCRHGAAHAPDGPARH